MPAEAASPVSAAAEPPQPQRAGGDAIAAATEALTPVQHMPWWILPSLALLILLIFAGALVASCFVGDSTLRTTMFTAAVTLATGAVGYYFGSSAGSQKKDDQIARSTAALAVSTPPTATITRTETVPDSSGGATTTTTTGPITTDNAG